MNKKLLCAALLGGLGVAQAASAQDFDDRWYLTGSTGFNLQDSDRDTDNALFVTLGLGKFISRNWSLDGELNYQNPKADANEDLNWSQYGVSLDLRRHFIAEGRNWNPYLLMGLGYQRPKKNTTTSRTRIRRASAKTATSPPSSASACRATSAASASAPNWPTALRHGRQQLRLQHRWLLDSGRLGSATCWLRSAS